MAKRFYAIGFDLKKVKVKLKCFGRAQNKRKIFVFTIMDDEMGVNFADVVATVQSVTISRGRHTFPRC